MKAFELARRIGYLSAYTLEENADETARMLNALICALRKGGGEQT